MIAGIQKYLVVVTPLVPAAWLVSRDHKILQRPQTLENIRWIVHGEVKSRP